jgi:hypothetical protein
MGATACCAIDGNEATRRGCSDGAIRRPGGHPLPGWRAGVARAGGRSSWRTRCGCGDKHSFGPGRRAVKRLNGPMAKEPQASSAWAFAVGLSNLTLREFACLVAVISGVGARGGQGSVGAAHHRAVTAQRAPGWLFVARFPAKADSPQHSQGSSLFSRVGGDASRTADRRSRSRHTLCLLQRCKNHRARHSLPRNV